MKRASQPSRFQSRAVSSPVGLALLVALALLAFVGGAAAQEELTVQDILTRHYQARGGLEKIRALDGLEITGTFEVGGMSLPVKIVQARPNLFRMEVDLQGQTVVQSFDGEMAWGVNPMNGDTEAAQLGPEQTTAMIRQADFEGVLVAYRRLGARLAYAGKVTLDGQDAHELTITRKDGAQETVWLGADDYLEKRWKRTAYVEGVGETEVTEDVMGYSEVQGVKMNSILKVQGPTGPMVFTYTSIEPRSDLVLADFQMPGQEADPALSLDQVLAKHEQNRLLPGSEKVTTVKATGKVVFQGFELPMTMVFARPSSARVSIDMQGMEMVLASDGETAWTVSPMQGITEPEKFGPEAQEAVELFSDFLWGLLTDHQARGLELELLGIDKAGRHQAYHVKATTGAGKVRELWLGGEDFLELQISLEAVFLGAAQTLVATLGDYQATGPILMPHEISITGDTLSIKLTVDSVEVDPEVDPMVFQMPAPKTQGEG